jgi:succinoglycan biosynthesis transport protein ExoP
MGQMGWSNVSAVDPTEEIGVLDYARALWRRKFTILLVVVIAVAATVAVDTVRTKKYQGTANLLFISQSRTTTGSVTALSATDIATDIGLVQGATVKALVAKKLKTAPPAVAVAEQGATEIATITVTSTDPVFAAKAANAYAAAYVLASQQRYLATSQAAETQLQAQITALQTQINAVQAQINQTDPKNASALSNLDNQLGSLTGQQTTLQSQLSQVQVNVAQSPSGGQLVQPATPNHTPVSPKPVTDALIALGVGLVLGIGLALLRERLDDRIRTKTELERVAKGLPSLGLIPTVGEWRDRKKPFLIAAEHAKSPPAEAYRGLRTSIQFIGLDRSIKTVQITSPAAADGKTTTSANLAVTMAESGQSVVLVSCDLRRPRIHEFFGVGNNIGFTSVLVGDASLEDALISLPKFGNLTLLPSGPVPPNPSELLGSTKARDVFSLLAQAADVVVIDSPPVLPVTDAAVLATHVDAVLLVAAAKTTTRRDVTRSIELLNRVSAPIVGLVLNRASEADCYVYYRYGDQYGYGYGYGARKEPRGGVQANGKPHAVAPSDLVPQNGSSAIFEPEAVWSDKAETEKIVRDA